MPWMIQLQHERIIEFIASRRQRGCRHVPVSLQEFSWRHHERCRSFLESSAPARAKLQTGHSQEAIDLANKALAARIYGVEPLLIKALAALQLEQYEQAVRDSSRYLEADGKSIKAIHVRGAALSKLGKTVEAIEDFYAALRLAPDMPSRGQPEGRYG
jgi:tetratricopeptide (TPR) repeat protein